MLHVQYMRAIDPLIECVLQGTEVFLKKLLIILRNKWKFYSLFRLFLPLSCVCVCTYIRYNTYISACSFCQTKEMSSSNIIFFLLIKQEDTINFQEREGLIMFPLPLQTHWTVNISKGSSLLSHSPSPALHSCFEAAILKGSDTEISNPVSTSQQDFRVLLKIRQHFFVLRPSRHPNKEQASKHTKWRWHCSCPGNSLKEILHIKKKITKNYTF